MIALLLVLLAAGTAADGDYLASAVFLLGALVSVWMRTRHEARSLEVLELEPAPFATPDERAELAERRADLAESELTRARADAEHHVEQARRYRDLALDQAAALRRGQAREAGLRRSLEDRTPRP